MKYPLLSILFTAALIASHAAEPRKAFGPGEIWPDNNGVHINAHGGGILFHEGAYYWFGEHKIEGGAGNVAHVGVHVYSSNDLYNWKDEGIALPVSDDPKSVIAKGCIIERPKVIFNKKTGKFVMWFHLELLGQGYDAARCAVAVADKVTGPYRFIESLRPNAGFWPMNVPESEKKPLSAEEQAAFEPMRFNGGPDTFRAGYLILRAQHAGGQMSRDMTAFVDDDGKAYLIYASEHNGTLQISQLDDTYTKHIGKYIRVAPLGINESPTMFKHASRYYMITSRCNGWAPSDARLLTAKSIWGPWELLGNPCVGPEDRMKVTFESQSTHVLPVQGKKDAFIFMADRWRPENAIDGRYIWLPIEFDKTGKPFIQWRDKWDLSVFDARPETAGAKFTDNGRMLKLAAPGIDGFVSGFSATVEIGGVRKVLRSTAAKPAALATAREQTPYGTAQVTVSTVEFPSEKLSLELRVGQVKDVPGVLVQPVLHNRGTQPVKLISLAAVDMPALPPALRLPRDGDKVWLVPEAATAIREGHGQCQSGLSTGGKPISIGGKTFTRGLGTHARSEIEIPLGGAFTRFRAFVGADDEIDGGSVGFEVLVDGQKRFDSGVMRKGDAAKKVDVDVSGASNLLLVVNDGGDGIACDHADWAYACLSVDPAVNSSSALEAKLALPGLPGEWLVTAYDQSSRGGGINFLGTLAEISNGMSVHEYGSIYRKDGSGFLFGPVGEPIAYLQNRVSGRSDGAAALLVSSDMSGLRVDPGESRTGQQAVLLVEPPRQALARWSEWVAETHGARTEKGALTGWCSWYHLTNKIKESDLLGVVDAVKKDPVRLRPQVIQIDDGYQDFDGKWDANEKFPRGMPYYAKRIAETGARPGIWMAITMMGVKHPWLQDPQNMEAVWGKRFKKESDFRPDESGWLDPTHPRAMAYIVDRVRHAVDSGFSYLKLDFNDTVMSGDKGNWYEKKKTSFQIMREHYRRIRKAAGEDTYILACIIEPNRAVLGLVDAHRTSHDAHRGGVRSAVNDVLRSYHLNDRWLAVDNDIYYIAPDANEVGAVQGGWNLHRTWLSMMGLSGGAALTSDPWHWDVLKPHLRTVEIMQPPAKMRSDVLDLGTAKDWPRLVSTIKRPWGDSAVALLWNPAEQQTQSITLDLAQAGLDPARSYAVWSFWDDKFLGTAKGTWTTPTLEGWACQHLVFTPIDGTAAKAPVLIGSNLHISSGVAEVKAVKTSVKGIQVALTDAGARDGKLFFHSTKPLKLSKATGLEIGQIEPAGENIWSVEVRARKPSVAQSLQLTVP